MQNSSNSSNDPLSKHQLEKSLMKTISGTALKVQNECKTSVQNQCAPK